MQHDLKTIERRKGEEPFLAAWCICGGWRHMSRNLHLTPIVEGFIEHLEELAPYLQHTQHGYVSPDAPF